MAKRGRSGPSRGRFLAILLGIFILAMGVIARRTLGISQTRAIRQLEERRDAADAARVRLESEIREASSRARLGPVVEQRLHMYVPPDSQVIILPRQQQKEP
jgi:cell division protein FtsL